MDLAETIIDYIKHMPDLGETHVGEQIPEEMPYPFIWLMKSSELPSDDLCHPVTIDQINFDVEVVSDDIQQSRDLTAKVKRHLITSEVNSMTFENDAGNYQRIHGIDVDDHDDEYIRRTVGEDNPLHIGALDVQIILGA